MGPMGKALGLGSKPTLGADEEEGESYEPTEEEEPESELPPGFEASFEEYSSAPTAQGLYDLIEMCKGGGAPKKPGGLLALISGGKDKE